MGKNKFEEFLNKKDSEEVKIDWDAKKVFFIKKVNEFYNQLDCFLEPYVDKISIDDEEHTISEEKLGNYNIKKRVLNIKNNKVTFTPIGTILIGAWGRIDMESQNGIVKFVLIPENSTGPKIESAILETEDDKKRWEEKQKKSAEENKQANKVWKIATPPPNIHYIDLTEETFFDTLMEMING